LFLETAILTFSQFPLDNLLIDSQVFDKQFTDHNISDCCSVFTALPIKNIFFHKYKQNQLQRLSIYNTTEKNKSKQFCLQPHHTTNFGSVSLKQFLN